MAKKISGITIAIGADTTGVTNGLKDIGKQSSSVNSELRDVGRLLKLNPSNVELVAQKQQLLSKQVEITTKKLDGLKGAQADVERQLQNGDIGEEQYRAFQREVVATEGKLSHYTSALNDVETQSEGAGESTKGLGGKMDDLSESVDTVATGIKGGVLIEAADQISAVGEKIIEVGDAAKEFALETDESYGKFYANTNLSGKALEELKGVAQEVFESGVTDSIDEATDATATMKQAFSELDNTSLAKLTSQVITLSERTGTDVKENVKGTQQLMNAFGLDAKSAFDLIADGYKNGLNSSDDFMDTLNEYAPLFQQAGFSAQDMLSIMKNGLDNGAMNTDKVADAVKELQIRLGDGSFEANMGTFSKATQTSFQEWKKGKATVADVAQSIQKDLNKMTPSEKQAALSALSSQFEDLGIKAGSSLFNIGKEFDNVNGKLDEATKKTASQDWQSALNEIQTALLPIGTDILNALMPVINFLGDMMSAFNDLPGPVKTFIESFGGIVAVVTVLAPIIAGIVAIFALFGSTVGIVISVIAGIIAVISGIITAVQNWGSITEWLSDKWNGFSEWLGSLWDGIKQVTEDTWNNITSFLGDLWQGIVTKATDIFSPIINVITVIFMTIQSVIDGVWLVITSLLQVYWNAIATLANTIFSPIIDFFSGIWNSISSKVSEVWNTIFAVLSSVWNSISTVAISIWQGIVSFLTGIWNGIKLVATSVFTALSSFISGIWQSISGTLSGIWNGISSTASGIFNGIKSNISNAFNSIKSIATSVWNGVKSAITTPIEAAKNTVSRVIDTIKGFFSGLQLKFPSISMPKLPHFKLNGSFSLNPPSVPKLSVDWFAKGGILTKPTVFGQNGNSLMVGGEAGKEAVAPLSDLMGYVEDAVSNQMSNSQQALLSKLNELVSATKELANRPVVAVLDLQDVTKRATPLVTKEQAKNTSIMNILEGRTT